MTAHEQPTWRQRVRRLAGLQPNPKDSRTEGDRLRITDTRSNEMWARALECNLFVLLPDRNIMIVGADDQDPGPAAPPFADFLRVTQDERQADYVYQWMIDLLPDDPQVFLELAVSRPITETFLFSFPVPQFTPFLERIERDDVLHLSTRSSIEQALTQHQADLTVAIPFDGATHISELLQRYVEWDTAGRPR
jgi:hypothetical protein